MPWKKLRNKLFSNVLSLVGEGVKLAGNLLAGVGAIGIGLLLVTNTTIHHLEDKPIGASFSSHADANTTLYIELQNSPGDTFGPYYQNFSQNFLEESSFTLIPSNSGIGSALSLAMNFAPLVIVAGLLTTMGGGCLSGRAARLREDNLDEAYQQGFDNPGTQSHCFKKKACGGLRSILNISSTGMMLSGFAMQGEKQVLQLASNQLPINYIKTLSPFAFESLFKFMFSIKGVPLVASVAASLKTSNTTAELKLAQVVKGLKDTLYNLPDAIPYSLYCGAVFAQYLSAICSHHIQCYEKHEEGEKKGEVVGSRDVEMGYSRLVN